MRKALIVGIDHYDHLRPLRGCVADANSVGEVLERNSDGTVNFATPRMLLGTGPADGVGRSELKDAVRDLFADDAEIALLYFAGHGYIEDTGGFLCTSDSSTGDDGLALADLMRIAGRSGARNKVIVLDSCHGGVIGALPDDRTSAEIREGMTILTASTADQYATEGAGGGVFTRLFVDALHGSAANLVGDVTPGSVYAHIDQSLGPWGGQRPMFKTNVKSFVSLRRTPAPIPLEDLRALASHFPTPDFDFRLDPAYEPERSAEQSADPEFPPPDPAKTAIFAVLQRYVQVNLVRPVGETHMWHAAMNGKSCRLTVLGRHYRSLVADRLI